MTANELTAAILKFLTEEGWNVWRANSGYSGRHNMKLSPPGTPDIIGYNTQGRFAGVEVKVEGDTLRESQVAFLRDLALTRLGIYYVARTYDGFLDWYRRGEAEGFPARWVALHSMRGSRVAGSPPDTADKS